MGKNPVICSQSRFRSEKDVKINPTVGYDNMKRWKSILRQCKNRGK